MCTKWYFYVAGLLLGLMQSLAYAEAFPTKAYDLENGLRLIVRQDNRADAVVSQLWYKVGSANEPLGLTGISHALEHMMFQGTPKNPGQTFTQQVQRVGGQLNAFTSDDMTVYYEVLSASHLPLSFALEADRMQGLLLDEAAFKTEMQVVMEERRLRTEDKPLHFALERFMAAALPASPYQNPTVGWQIDLDNMTIEDLRQWYTAWYAPNNAVLVVVGNVEHEAVYELAKNTFGRVPRQHLTARKPVAPLKPVGQKRLQIQTQATVPQLIMGYNVPTFATGKLEDVAALALTSVILDGGRSARFSQHIVREQQLAASLNTYYSPVKQHPELFMFVGVPSKGTSLDVLENSILAEVARLQDTPVSATALQRAKTLWRAQTTYGQDPMDYAAYRIGHWESIGLGWENGARFDALIQDVDASDIQRVAQTYLTAAHLTVGEVLPRGDKHD